ncbi:MAG: polymer-forming cytoskeletal protein [Candidatus Delongbacteria bacterium]|nr:polymer-forming cytoskeletal protein [Candidatus Delongbacteria bacterium]
MAKDTPEIKSASLTIISQGTIMEGVIQSSGNLRLDGSFKGKITVDGNLVIGKEGIAQAEIACTSLTIAGKVKGNLNVQEQAILEKESLVIGDIITKSLVIHEGAVFHGYNKIRNIDSLQKEWKTGHE